MPVTFPWNPAFFLFVTVPEIFGSPSKALEFQFVGRSSIFLPADFEILNVEVQGKRDSPIAGIAFKLLCFRNFEVECIILLFSLTRLPFTAGARFQQPSSGNRNFEMPNNVPEYSIYRPTNKFPNSQARRIVFMESAHRGLRVSQLQWNDNRIL